MGAASRRRSAFRPRNPSERGEEQTATLLSGIQPSGTLHIGNYLGALRQWSASQQRHRGIFCVADLHAITEPDRLRPGVLRRQIREAAAMLLACGIDPTRSIVFVQSDVPAHAMLAWILGCVTPLGWLRRMTQFKDRAGEQERAGAGLLMYPALQAADILLYKAALVPVGEDQKQHVELARDIAERFNRLFGDVFPRPEPVMPDAGGRIMGLDDPGSKMSKSVAEDRPLHAIGLLDPPDIIRSKIMSAVTDSGSEMRFEQAQPGVRNLLVLYESVTGESRDAIERRFAGQGYAALKRALSDQTIALLTPIQQAHSELIHDEARLEQILKDGARRARLIADETLSQVRGLVGLGTSRGDPGP